MKKDVKNVPNKQDYMNYKTFFLKNDRDDAMSQLSLTKAFWHLQLHAGRVFYSVDFDTGMTNAVRMPHFMSQKTFLPKMNSSKYQVLLIQK